MSNQCPICGKVLNKGKCLNCGYRSIDDFVAFRTISKPARPDLYVRQTCTAAAEQKRENAQKTIPDLNQNAGNNSEYSHSYRKANGTNNRSPEQETKKQSENANRRYSNGRAYDPNRFEGSFEGNVNSEKSQAQATDSENSNADKQATAQQKVNETDAKKYDSDHISYGGKCVLSIIIGILIGAIWRDTLFSTNVGLMNYLISVAFCFTPLMATYFFCRMVHKWDIPTVLKILIDLAGFFACYYLVLGLGYAAWIA